ncbi:MAG: serine hydrolase [Acidobacteria bacterium]|nr:serine hydrolase [Acidobacteriota bacterium]
MRTEIVVPKGYQSPKFSTATQLDALLKAAVDSAIDPANGKNFKLEELSATLIDVSDPRNLRWANVRGETPIYPASVVKMFYMAALERQLEDGKITLSPELTRGLKDMIVDSSNEATQYILDVLTDTSSGSELPLKQFEKWQYQRNRVNRFFASMGYTNININQKTFCEDAYGIEQQSRNYKGQNRNMITTNATARLLAEIVLGKMNTPDRTAKMMELMHRDWSKPSSDQDDQAVGFTGKALIDGKIAGAKLWSKAGWTSKSRHDAAYIETVDGLKFVLAVYTENHANDREAIPAIAAKVMTGLSEIRR